MAAPIVHRAHEMVPNAVLMSAVTIVALLALWVVIRPMVEGHGHGRW